MSDDVRTADTAVPPTDVSHLAALIRDQASAEVAQIVAAAEERAQRVRAAAAVEVAAIDARARAAGEARGRRRAAALLAEAETRGQRVWLWARERLLEDVLARAATCLAELPVQAETIEALAGLVEAAVAVLPQEPVRIRVAKGYEGLLGLMLDSHLASAERAHGVQAAEVPGGGVIVETESGRLCVDHSFAGRIRRLRNDLRAAAARVLFAE